METSLINKPSKQYSAAEGYLNLIGDLISTDEENALKDKLKDAIKHFYNKQTGRYETKNARSYSVLDNPYDNNYYKIDDDKPGLNLETFKQMYKFNDTQIVGGLLFVSSMVVSGLAFGISGMLSSAVFSIMAGQWILLGPAAIVAMIMGTRNRKNQTDDTPKNRFLNFMKSDEKLQYDFMTEVFPAVIDNHLKHIGDSTITDLNEKNNELQRILSDMHNNRKSYVLDNEQLEEVTEKVKDKCTQINELILGLNSHISKLDAYKENTMKIINKEKRIFDKKYRTQKALDKLESIGVEIEEIHNKVINWSVIIDHRLTDLVLEGDEAIREAQFLLEV